MITNVNPEPGARIYWGRTPMTVSRTAKPTFPGGVPLVYAEPISGGPETFLPSGSWAYEPFGDAPEVDAPSPLWHTVEEAIHATLVRITATESAGVSLRDTAGLLAGTIASIVGAGGDAEVRARLEQDLADSEAENLGIRSSLELKSEMLDDMRSRVQERDAEIAGLNQEVARLRTTAEAMEAALGDGDYKARRWGSEVDDNHVESFRSAAEARTGRTCDIPEDVIRVGLEAARGYTNLRRSGGPEPRPLPHPLQYLPLSEVTDGHVAAYRKAYLAEARKFNEAPAPIELDQCIRAGLAAIQWPSREVEAGPEMREVPLSEAKEGDTITVSARVTQGRASGVVEAADAGVTIRVHPPHVEGRVTVTRPASTLPDERGAVIRADIGRGWPVIAELCQAKVTQILRWLTTDGEKFTREEMAGMVRRFEVLVPAGVPLLDGEEG